MNPAEPVQRPNGRFAPSPSGNLHFGSLVTALASFLNIKQAQGRWLVRIEDIDTPRSKPGIADQILSCLDAFGLHWDGKVSYQSKRLDIYQSYLDTLRAKDSLYPCTCTRARLKSLPDGYDRHCLTHPPGRQSAYAWRCKTHHTTPFVDQIFGLQSFPVDDFIVKRKDGLFAYQFVVVVDDLEQGISEVLRGCDLLSVTPRQIALYDQLNAKQPTWLHLPLVANSRDTLGLELAGNGQPSKKLSKSHGAPELTTANARQLLHQALIVLGQMPPKDLCHNTVEEILSWALSNWQLDKIPKQNYYDNLKLE